MTQRYGIDTSVLVRLATGVPPLQFQRSVTQLTALVEKEGAQIVASNQVIGETYIALQHHYGADKLDARAAIAGVLQSGLIEALSGHTVQVISTCRVELRRYSRFQLTLTYCIMCDWCKDSTAALCGKRCRCSRDAISQNHGNWSC